MSTISRAALWMLAGAMTIPSVVSAGRAAGPLPTRFELIVGIPSEPAESAEGEPLATGEVLFAEDEVTSHDLSDLKEKLRYTYRLKAAYTTAVAIKDLVVGAAMPMPTEPSELAVELTLLDYDDATATYQVRLSVAGELLASPRIVVKSGGRAIVAARDGERAPYAFIVVEARPDLPEPKRADGVVEPRVVEKVKPLYPEEARKSKVQGVVVVSLALAPDGSVADTTVLRAAGSGLTEAALDAVKRWRYEPAPGNETRVVVVSITFRLE